ncbi:hypothetical protein PLESTB_000950600 [Pleodorina starrii]|uniref:BTB domain-containing protein n=1 Tax=Pleodorina starrii TaxID=330485 RepID=A0A9W6BND8_9CHLO|nr:hypothetical protein PLESTM_001148200 [Pleodorina starrii]GLC55163.1 hypothetical protein PLESTB_000950600 [Pleodorina starrii]GLC71084.1 hypothetical protein PLESTF_001072900 [Pleodorina starrii]
MNECPNRSVLRGLAEVFASGRSSDCDVIFCRECNTPNPSAPSRPAAARGGEGDDPQPPTGDGAGPSGTGPSVVFFGEPLPAHRLILTLASPRFAAQLERWSAEHPPGPSAAEAATAVGGRCQLRVPLGSEAEVPAARAAIRFAYTGEVAAGSSSSVLEVLEVRRQADYLEIKGCVAACDKVLKAMIKASGAGGTKEGGSGKRVAGPEIFELFGAEALWPDLDAEPGFGAIVASAKRRLVPHFRNSLAVLNTPSLRGQLLALPATGVEALLASTEFGTDNEASVLLLLAVWMDANHRTTATEVRQRLCSLVRLPYLGRPYFSLVLPALAANFEKNPNGRAGWFSGVTVTFAAFLAAFTGAAARERQCMLQSAPPATVPALQMSSRRQCISPTDGLTFRWHISKDQLLRVVRCLPPASQQGVHVHGIFDQQSRHDLFAWGFIWGVFIKISAGQPTAGLYLCCRLPAAVAPHCDGTLTAMTVVPISARLVVHRRQGNAQSNVHVVISSSEDFVTVGSGVGASKLLPLRQPPPQGAAGGATAAAVVPDPLAAWADYLVEGKITGTLTLLAPESLRHRC